MNEEFDAWAAVLSWPLQYNAHIVKETMVRKGIVCAAVSRIHVTYPEILCSSLPTTLNGVCNLFIELGILIDLFRKNLLDWAH